MEAVQLRIVQLVRQLEERQVTIVRGDTDDSFVYPRREPVHAANSCRVLPTSTLYFTGSKTLTISLLSVPSPSSKGTTLGMVGLLVARHDDSDLGMTCIFWVRLTDDAHLFGAVR